MFLAIPTTVEQIPSLVSMEREVIHMPCCLPPWETQTDSSQRAPADR